ncbi:MAG: 50S ribosomal protein L24 [Patescibacteria group bacterium]|nr:50S ribosomal protein L24 [Patescibacteria group bacterium]
MKIKTGDKVIVIKGKDRGKTGIVVSADPVTHQIKVEGVNVYKRHQRKGAANKPGGVIEIVAPLDVSKVMLVCPETGKPTRVGYKQVGEKKQRVARVSGAIIENAKK